MAIDLKLIDQLLTDYKQPDVIIGEHGCPNDSPRRRWSGRSDTRINAR
jgi:hypothetical protein